jgi:hypothetical protein
MGAKALGVLCVLIMVTAGFVGCIPVSANSDSVPETVNFSGPGFWTYTVYPCSKGGTYAGLHVKDVSYANHYYLHHGYQTGIRYQKTSGGAWTNLALDDFTCTQQWINSSTQHQLINWWDKEIDVNHNIMEYMVSIVFYDDASYYTMMVYQSIKVYPSTASCWGFQVFWKLEWDIIDQPSDYIDHKVSGSWAQISTERQIDAKNSSEGVRYRQLTSGYYSAYATHSDVGYSSLISNVYWGAFKSPYNDPYNWQNNINPLESVVNTDIVGGFYMDLLSHPAPNTLYWSDVYYHVTP